MSTALLYQVGYLPSLSWKEISEDAIDTLSEINKLCEFKIMDVTGTPIGSRMGRPEKAKIRKLKGSPQGIFPCGKEGGRMRNLISSFDLGYINSNFPVLFCETCNKGTIYIKCEKCGSKTKEMHFCEVCKQSVDVAVHCSKNTIFYKPTKIDAKYYVNNALKNLGVSLPELVKGVKGTWSKKRIPEHLEKAILRAIHEVYVNKDGTIRYDMIEAPITHFKPVEIGTSVEKIKELGYKVDIDNNPLEKTDQLIAIMPQDIILPDCQAMEESRSPETLVRICNFIDDLLVKFYNEDKFYNVKTKDDLIGQLVIGLAPHTSAGIVGRIIGFSQTQGFYAHPYYHAAMRRNCLTSDSMIYFKNSHELHTSTIEEFFERYADNPKVSDMYGSEEIDLVNKPLLALSSDTFGNYNEKKIVKAFRRKYSGDIIKITCKSNQEIKTTPEHRLWVFDDNQLVEKMVMELKEGDLLASLNRVEDDEHKINDINIINLLSNDAEIENLTVRTSREFCDKIKSQIKLPKAKFNNIFSRRPYAIPLTIFNQLKIDSTELTKFKIGFKRNFGQIPVLLNAKKFAKLLGYYISEGCAWQSKVKNKNSWHVDIAASNLNVQHDIRQLLDNLDINYTVFKTKITITSKILYKIFVEKLNLGAKAHKKQISDIVLNWPKELVFQFLSGLYQGDGNVYKREIKYTTVSEKLAMQLYFLLTKLNFTPSFRIERDKIIKSGLVYEKYKAKNIEPPRTTLHYVCLNSTDAEQFAKSIVLLDKKKEKLDEIKSIARNRRLKLYNNLRLIPIKKIEIEQYEGYVYDIQLEKGDKIFAAGKGQLLSHNCDGDESSVMMLLDGLLNFSRQFLPDSRGSRSMDAPLVLTTVLVPNEVDDEVHNLDVSNGYPIELYESSLKLKYPWDISNIKQIKQFLGKEGEYDDVGYTHPVSSINLGPKVSAYKTLVTMMDKVEKQMELAEKIDAVDESDVASMVVEKHFLKDIKGNFRRFGSQNVRCVECNEKYRRVTMAGVCTKCKGKLILTVAHGTVTKYIEPSEMLINKYNVPPYLKQVFETIKRSVDSVFKIENKKQTKLMNY